MAVTLVAEQKFPVDNANDTGTTLTLDKDAADWSTLSTNDFIIIFGTFKASGITTSVTTTGGQTWSEEQDLVGTVPVQLFVYTAFFNGTWSADPVITQTGAAVPRIMWAIALRGVDTSTPWDVAETTTNQTANTTWTDATYNTVTNGAWAFYGGPGNDNVTTTVDNSFVAPSGAGNVYHRSSGGTDNVFLLARKEIATAGAVGQTIFTHSLTLGGLRLRGAIRPAAVAAATSLIYDSSMNSALLVR